MTKIKLFQLRLFRTIRRQICSIDMIDIETFTNIFRLLNHVDRSIIEKYTLIPQHYYKIFFLST